MKAIAAAAEKKAALTIDEAVGLYQLSNIADGKSPRTIGWYSDILKAFSRYLKAEHQSCGITDFTIEKVRGYILRLRSRPRSRGHLSTPEHAVTVSPRTVQCHVRALKAFSSWLHAEGYTAENRLSILKLPKAPSRVMEPLTPGEIDALIKAIDRKTPAGLRNHALLVTLLDTGLRASEVAGITLGHLDLDGGRIRVMGKGSKERVVPIGKFVQRTLWRYIEDARPALALGNCDRLFLSRSGKPLTLNTVKLIFSRLAKSSGVKRLHAHLCRHTFAINYLLNGGDVFSLQEILGHSTLDMVRHYLRFTSSQITAQHHKYSPMDRLQKGRVQAKDSAATSA